MQPHSGSSANLAALFALLEPGDTMLAMELAHGGHLTHGLGINYSGRTYNVVPYHVRPDTEIIDYDEVRALALEHRPKLIICGYSSYPRIVDFAAFREIADECGAHAAGRHRPHRRAHRRRRAPQPGAVLRRRHQHHAQDAHRPARRHHHVPQGVRRGHRPGGVPGHAGRPAHARHRRQGGVPAHRPERRSSTSCSGRSSRTAPCSPRRWPRAACVSSPAAPTCTWRSSTCAAPASPASSARSCSSASTSRPTATSCRSRTPRSTWRAACASARRRSARGASWSPRCARPASSCCAPSPPATTTRRSAEIRHEVVELLDRFPLYEFL